MIDHDDHAALYCTYCTAVRNCTARESQELPSLFLRPPAGGHLQHGGAFFHRGGRAWSSRPEGLPGESACGRRGRAPRRSGKGPPPRARVTPLRAGKTHFPLPGSGGPSVMQHRRRQFRPMGPKFPAEAYSPPPSVAPPHRTAGPEQEQSEKAWVQNATRHS